nr:MAG TPA: hypothetical protein [Inoviridae sp.]
MSLVTGLLSALLDFEPFLWFCSAFVFSLAFVILRALLYAFDRRD